MTHASFSSPWRNFFFASVPADGFGLMRIAWALVTLASLLVLSPDITWYFSDAGFLLPEVQPLVLRSGMRFTILSSFGNPVAVAGLFVVLCFALLCVLLGFRTRFSLLLSVLLLFSFHERNPIPLGGGDMLLRYIGYILLLTPNPSMFSIDHVLRKRSGAEKECSMPIWPYRLLLWQVILLYGMSAWNKLLGDMWLNGTAFYQAFQHPQVIRWPHLFGEALQGWSPLFSWITLVWELMWLLLLVPATVLGPIIQKRLKYFLLVSGVIFHLLIALFMEVGVFSAAVIVAYLGLTMPRFCARSPDPQIACLART